MEYQQAVAFYVGSDGIHRKAEAYHFYKLVTGDTLVLSGPKMDISNVRKSASQYGARHRCRLRVEQIAVDAVRVTREMQNPLAVEYGRRGGARLGAEAASIDALEAGGAVVLPWRTNGEGLRVQQAGLWQLISRAVRRGEGLGKAFYTMVVGKGVEVRRIK